MGGSRCIFRDCSVSSRRHPKMHFFYLPVRDNRLLTWLKHCDRMDILQLTREQQAHRAVCARHFRYECFMNYKLDRLIPGQSPSLVRLSKDVALDLENLDDNGEPLLVKLQTPKLPHLIPPKDFVCPLGFESDSPLKTYQLVDKHHSKTIRREKTSKPTSSRSKPSASSSTKIRKVALKEINSGIEQDIIPAIMNDLKHPVTHAVAVNKEVNNVDSEPNTKISSYIDLETPAIKQITESKEQRTAVLKLQQDHIKEELDKMTLKYELLLKEKLNLEAKCANLAQTRTVSLLSHQLTKQHLFAGVKKYLGPTMTALVRMEMFGSAERTWKNDERDFAMELLKLGENVYKHCTDEWRFRLPALRDAHNWLNNKSTADEEDIDF